MNGIMLAVIPKIMLATNWELNTFLNKLGKTMQVWGQLIMIILGVAMLIAAAFFIAKGLMSQGRGQTNWALVILLFVIGGVFLAGGLGGWNTFVDISNGMNNTVQGLGQ